MTRFALPSLRSMERNSAILIATRMPVMESTEAAILRRSVSTRSASP